MKKTKGFTLIELMIVLGIIAVLAVVLVPKAGIFKGQAKNAGVTTNINTVRAYLETKTGDNFIEDADDLTDALESALTGEDELKNPLDEEDPAVRVFTETEAEDDEFDFKGYKGSVVIVVGGSQYTIYGVDNGGAKIAGTTIK